jgi:hypothetical protein
MRYNKKGEIFLKRMEKIPLIGREVMFLRRIKQKFPLKPI